MTITFDTDLDFPNGPAVPCSCAQNMPLFCEAMDLVMQERELTAELVVHCREHAWPGCKACGGSGTMEGYRPHASYVQVNSAVLGALGLEDDRGSCTIPEARRALIRARSRSLAPFVIPEALEHAPPRVDERGVVELRPVKFLSFEVGEDRIGRMVEKIGEMVERHAAAGATKLRWF